jgi:hypothetical protein
MVHFARDTHGDMGWNKDDDTEGHSHSIKDDTKDDTKDDDTEGHSHSIKDDTKDDDTEGHNAKW